MRGLRVDEMLIFTDLDGTLLDHDHYDFQAASEALDIIRRRRIPLILTSSKTRSEIEALQLRLGINWPYICENGAAIYERGSAGSSVLKQFARPRSEVLDILRELRLARGYPFAGFADWNVQQIARETGLSMADAALAADRDYSEPLKWQGGEAQRADFETQITSRGLVAQRGGRFLSVSSPSNKAQAMQWLNKNWAGTQKMIALGDSPNDLAMLAAADIAVIISSGQSASMQVSGLGQVLRSTQPGPAGWQQIMGPLLEQEKYDG